MLRATDDGCTRRGQNFPAFIEVVDYQGRLGRAERRYRFIVPGDNEHTPYCRELQSVRKSEIYVNWLVIIDA